MHDLSKTLPVTRLVTLDLIDARGNATPLDAEFSYDPQEPYELAMTFMTSAGRVRWICSRDLLIGGLYEPTGLGDVHVWPTLDSASHAVVIIELCSPDGECLVQARASDMRAFVDQITAAVPQGTESELVDVDAAIAAVFAAEGM